MGFNDHSINLGNGAKFNLRKLTVNQRIEDLNLTKDEIKIFEHFAGKDRVFQQEEIDHLQSVLYEYSLYHGDYDLDSKEAQKAMKKEGLKGLGDAFMSLLQKMSANENTRPEEKTISTKLRDGRNYTKTIKKDDTMIERYTRDDGSYFEKTTHPDGTIDEIWESVDVDGRYSARTTYPSGKVDEVFAEYQTVNGEQKPKKITYVTTDNGVTEKVIEEFNENGIPSRITYKTQTDEKTETVIVKCDENGEQIADKAIYITREKDQSKKEYINAAGEKVTEFYNYDENGNQQGSPFIRIDTPDGKTRIGIAIKDPEHPGEAKISGEPYEYNTPADERFNGSISVQSDAITADNTTVQNFTLKPRGIDAIVTNENSFFEPEIFTQTSYSAQVDQPREIGNIYAAKNSDETSFELDLKKHTITKYDTNGNIAETRNMTAEEESLSPEALVVQLQKALETPPVIADQVVSNDRNLPGARWVERIQRNSDAPGFHSQENVQIEYTRLEDGTLKKEEGAFISANGRHQLVTLTSIYQKDDKTPIETQSIALFANTQVVATKKFDDKGKLESINYNLDDYNKNKSLIAFSLSHTIMNMIKPSANFEIKDKKGTIILTCKDGKAYDSSGKELSERGLQRFLNSIDKADGLVLSKKA